MADQLLDIAKDPIKARDEAPCARQDYVLPKWEKSKVFADLIHTLRSHRDDSTN